MPAQLDAPSPSPQPCAGDQRAGLCFGLSFPPPFFISPVLFVSSTLWVGIAATCWLSDSRADCPLTVHSPEQKSRREVPPYALNLLLPCLWKALALLKTPSSSSGEARAEAVFTDCPAPQLATEREWNSLLAKTCLGLLLPLALLPMGLAPLWSFWKVPSQPPVFWWKHRKGRSPQWQGQATCPGGSGASSSPPGPVLGCL